MTLTFSVQNDHILEELWNGWISKNYELQRNFLCDFTWSGHFLQYLQTVSEVSGASRRELIHGKGEDLAWVRSGPFLDRKGWFNWDRHRDDAVVHDLRTYAKQIYHALLRLRTVGHLSPRIHLGANWELYTWFSHNRGAYTAGWQNNIERWSRNLLLRSSVMP